MKYDNFKKINSIELLFDEVEKALSARLYLIALMGALTIPDVLSAIEYGKSSGDNYAKWVDNFVIDGFGVKYGERKQFGKYGRDENDIEYERTLNEKYLGSPTSMCGDNCYQLRCSLLHDVKNEIKGSEKSGRARKYVWIDECVLQFTQDEFSTGNISGYDTYLKVLDSGEIVSVAEKYCYINIKGLCHDIIRAAKYYIKNKESIEDQLPKIKINNGGGKMSSSLDSEVFTNNMRMWKKHVNNMQKRNKEINLLKEE